MVRDFKITETVCVVNYYDECIHASAVTMPPSFPIVSNSDSGVTGDDKGNATG